MQDTLVLSFMFIFTRALYSSCGFKLPSVSFHFSQKDSLYLLLQSRSISFLKVYLGLSQFLRLGRIILLDIEFLVILDCQGYHNKMLQTEWLRQQNFIFLTVLEAGSPRSKFQAGLVSGEAALLSLKTTPSCYVFTWPFLGQTCLERALWHLCQIRAPPL